MRPDLITKNEIIATALVVAIVTAMLVYLAFKEGGEREDRAAIACLAEGGVAVQGLGRYVCLDKGVELPVPRSNR